MFVHFPAWTCVRETCCLSNQSFLLSTIHSLNKYVPSIWYVQGSIHSRRRVNTCEHKKSLTLGNVRPHRKNNAQAILSNTGQDAGIAGGRTERDLISSSTDEESGGQAWLRKRRLVWFGSVWFGFVYFSAVRDHTVEKIFRESESSTKIISSFISFIYYFHWRNRTHEQTLSKDSSQSYEASGPL